MLTKEAVQELAQAQAITAADNATAGAFGEGGGSGLVALPKDFTIHDIEKHLSTRRRARGSMTTSVVDDFAAYAGAHQEAGATVFVDPDAMAATAVLNLGHADEPGHADNVAVYAPKKTAPFKALLAIATGNQVTQRAVAEFLEDWPGLTQFFHDGTELQPGRAIQAVRSINIEELRKLGSQQEQLSETRTAFESIKATSEHTLPTHIYFKCEPYMGLPERTFVLRLGVHTGGEKPAISLRITTFEKHAEQMAQELVDKVKGAFGIDSLPMVIGTYKARD